jgi:ABC-type uncharacterized transport system YnjBCD ATPase subunit
MASAVPAGSCYLRLAVTSTVAKIGSRAGAADFQLRLIFLNFRGRYTACACLPATAPCPQHRSNVDVSVTAKNAEGAPYKRLLVHQSAGFALPGEVVGIMGPSGSGKTTLLSSLADRDINATVEGSIFVGGAPRAGNFKRIASFVPQEDSLLGVLTVRETFTFAAALQGPKGVSVDALVANVLKELGLETAADVKVGDIFYKGCSGGQKRRVSIGVELMKQPCMSPRSPTHPSCCRCRTVMVRARFLHDFCGWEATWTACCVLCCVLCCVWRQR